MIKVITFDLDDTLWDLGPILKRANQELFSWLTAHASKFNDYYHLDDFDDLRRATEKRFPELAHSVTAVRLRWLEDCLLAAGYDEQEAGNLTQHAFEHFRRARNRVDFFQHAVEILDDLNQRYQLGSLSNGNADVELVGLGEHFDFSFSADLTGKAKPDPMMFNEALKFTGARPEEVIHVGDHPEHDILGAQQAGLHTLWINLNNKPWTLDSPPSIEVNCLSEIPARVDAFSSRL